MKRIIFLLLLSIAVTLSACNFAFAQSRTNRLTRPCPGSATPASVTISVLGEIALTPCSGQSVVYGSSFTQGSVVFAGSSGTFSQDNANFFWNNSAKTLLIGSVTSQQPDSEIELIDDQSQAVVSLHSFGTGWYPGVYGGHARGTLAAQTAVQSGDILFEIGARGYGTSLGIYRTVFNFVAAENFTGSAKGTAATIRLTPLGATTGNEYFRFQSTSLNTTSASQIGWSNSASNATTLDTGFARQSAGVIRATDGSTAIRGLIGGGAAVASAAALPLPTGRVFHVTGTTNITSITSTNFASGVCITLIFDGVLTFTDGGNLSIAGNFVTTADDTISLCFDGTNWFETGRSVN